MLNVKVTPEQAMLQDTARRFLRESGGFSRRQQSVASEAGFDAGLWREFARLGWLGLPFPERHGGSGGSALDLHLLLREFGRALVVEPYLSTVALGGLALLATASEEQQRRFLPALAGGELQLALALGEPHSGYQVHEVATVAERAGAGWRLRGHKAVVLGAPSADWLVVSARVRGAVTDPDGLSLFLVERTAPGVRLRAYETIDGRRAAEVLLEDVPVPAGNQLGEEGAAGAALEHTWLQANLALLGEGIGCVEGALHETTEYLKLREQFGQKLASFQALRHRVADMFVLQEELKALGLLAGASMARDSASAVQAVCAARAYAGEAGRRVCEEAVQLHGAIAITDEYIAGHYLKRIIALDRLFGDAQEHLDRYVRSRGAFQ